MAVVPLLSYFYVMRTGVLEIQTLVLYLKSISRTIQLVLVLVRVLILFKTIFLDGYMSISYDVNGFLENKIQSTDISFQLNYETK